MDQVKAGDICKIPGLPGVWKCILQRYDRFALLRVCPRCGASGVEAGEWFTCSDAKCRCVAVVKGGLAFVPCDLCQGSEGGIP